MCVIFSHIKVKLALCSETPNCEIMWGSRSVVPHILNLIARGTEWSDSPSVFFTQGNNFCYSLSRRLAGPHNQSGQLRKDSCPVRKQITISELSYQLYYLSSPNTLMVSLTLLIE